MNVVAASSQSKAATSSEWAQAHSGSNISELRTVIEAELSDLERLLTQLADESDARLERLTTTNRTAVANAQTALDEQIRRNEALAESLLRSEMQAEELRHRLQAALDAANAARDDRQTERTARERAERECEAASAAREQIVSTYEARLNTLHREREAMRADLNRLNQQFAMEAVERVRLADALKTVQQACAIVDAASTPQPEGHISASGDRRPEANAANESAGAERQPFDELLPASDASRVLKLVVPGQSAAEEVPPRLREYLTTLLEQVATTYWVDQRAYMADEVVERLTANLRYAAEAFAQRARFEGLSGTTFFERALSAKLDEESQTSLGRHLAIAAYTLVPAEKASLCAEAS